MHLENINEIIGYNLKQGSKYGLLLMLKDYYTHSNMQVANCYVQY